MKERDSISTIEVKPNDSTQFFGLTVEVIVSMDNYSLIRWNGQESIVTTADLEKAASITA